MKRHEPWADKVFPSGPTLKYLNGVRRYRIQYRTRERDTFVWKENTIEMVSKSLDDCFRRTLQRIRRPSHEVEVMHVWEVSAEQPIQTGRKVETVSQKEYEKQLEEAAEKTEYERKELLRMKGLWVP